MGEGEKVQQNEELIKNFKVTASLSYACETRLFPSRELRAVSAKQPAQDTSIGHHKESSRKVTFHH
jgi:hypothetical protein